MEDGEAPQLSPPPPPPPPPPSNPSEQQQEQLQHQREEAGLSDAPIPDDIAAPRPTPEELVLRAIAPVKPEYLCPPPTRSDPRASRDAPEADADADAGTDADKNGGKSNLSNTGASVVVKEKKSRRQLKRERKQKQKSALNICPEVAKCGTVSACTYKDKCRFIHDLDAFLLQKPADIEGSCPFFAADESCPYGIACRFSGTHGENMSSESIPAKRRAEINVLNKNLQKLLWKNKVRFPKADAQLKLLGLVKHNGANVKFGANELNDEMTCNPGNEVLCAPEICSEDKCTNDMSAVKDTRVSKKAKTQDDKNKNSLENANGTCHVEKCFDDCNIHVEPEGVSPGTLQSFEVDLSLKSHPREKKLIDFRGKLYLAPLTTVGNLPFRRICKTLGADITCGEMAMCTNLLQGQASEWALLRHHSSEDIFGVQICGAFPDTVARTVELIERECMVDYIDINMGCPIDIVVNKGAGSALLVKPMRMKNIIQAAASTISLPLTVKVRTGYLEGRNRVDSLVSDIGNWGASALTIHGRSRQQRYTKLADWDYIYECARKAPNNLQVLGNGDIYSYTDWTKHTSDCSELATCMIARGALIKPWIFTEIKEQRHWDISSGERFNILKEFVRFGLEHWGSDSKGVETTRRFLLEWLSYTYRYIPVGLLDIVPQRLNWRPPSYYGRDDLETLMASDSAADWIRISEMLLGKVPEGFTFTPKHKSNAYDNAENG